MGLLDTLYYYIEETRDPRTEPWPLLSVTAIFTLNFCYLYFIYGCGPRYMKDKPAYSLKTVIWCYNIFQIVANFLLVRSLVQAEWFTEVIRLCEPMSYSTSPQKMKLASTIWWAYLLKVFDFIETIFFILRKKNRQVSYLHVHHHVMTVFLCWVGVRYAPAGMACFFLGINCSVHVVMYIYYFLSSLNPTIQKAIKPYKPLITTIQMVQLCVVVAYMLISLKPSCLFPKIFAIMALPNVLLNLYFFYDFYKKSYKEPKREH